MRSVMGAVLGVALGVVCLIPSTTPVVADEKQDKAAAYFAKEEAKIAKWAIKLCWNGSTAADKQDLPWHGRWFAKKVLGWDSDHKKARARVGYRLDKETKKWVYDATLAAAHPDQNTRKGGETSEEYRARRAKFLRKHWDPVEPGIVERYLKIAKTCARRDWTAMANRAYRRVRQHDLWNVDALDALGYEGVDGMWMPKDWVEHYMPFRHVSDAPHAKVWSEFFGTPVRGMRGTHVQVYETSGTGNTAHFARVGEATWVAAMRFIGRKPDEAISKKIQTYLYIDEGYWPAWADERERLSKTLDDGHERSTIGYHSQHWWSIRRRDDFGDVDHRSGVCHNMTHVVLYHAFEGRRASWVDEGLAFHIQRHLATESSRRCVRKVSKDYGTFDATTRFSSPPYWHDFVYRIVKAGDDLPLRTLATRRAPEFHLEDGLKAWSMITWLRETQPDATIAYIADASREADHAVLIEQHFGVPPEELEEQWRTYVLSNY